MSPLLRLRWRPFAFTLPQAMVTAQGAWRERRGWLLRLEAPDGRLGWGEAAPLAPVPLVSGLPRPGSPECQATSAAPGVQTPSIGSMGSATAAGAPHPHPAQDPHQRCWDAIAALGGTPTLQDLEMALPHLPGPLGFAIGAALAEPEGLVGEPAGGWRPAPPPAWLLPAGEGALAVLEGLLAAQAPVAVGGRPGVPPGGVGITVKWKVAAQDDRRERKVLELLLARLPATARLRLDANGGWDRPTAFAWAEQLAGDPRLEWLEQPLPPADQLGLEALAQQLPVALDESLRADPKLGQSWPGWQVRRPALEGDPRPLLAELRAGRPRLMVSTALETGIGRRWVHHLAALQADGPTPTAPGLAPGWTPQGPLFAADPLVVWEAAA